MTITKRLKSKGFTLVELLVVIAIIAALAAMATPVIMKQQKKAAMTTAISNAKQVFMLMVEFDQDFGAFPSEASAGQDTDLARLTGSSNKSLSQFIAGGYIESEEIFYAKGGSTTTKKPDNDISAPGKILEAGECGFAYITNLGSSDNAGLPILCAPMPKTEKEFDPNPFGGRGVYLAIDGSVKAYRLSKKNLLKMPDGKTLFDSQVWKDAQTAKTPAPKIELAD